MANKNVDEYENKIYLRNIERNKLKKKYKTNRIRGLWKKFHKK